MRRLLPLVLLAAGCGMHRGPSVSRPNPVVDYAEPSITCDADSEGTIAGFVRHEETKRPLGNALILLQSNSLHGTREIVTDGYGRYRFQGLPPGTYTVQVLVGQANVSKVITLTESDQLLANFKVDPDRAFICGIPSMQVVLPDQSLFSITSETEARMLDVPRTVRRY